MRLNKILNAIFCVAAGLYLPMIAGQAAAQGTDALAVIGDKHITVEDFRAEMQKLGHGLPGSFGRPEQREELLANMVRSETAYAAALKEGYEKKTEVIEQIKRVITNQYRKEKLEPQLDKLKITDEEIKIFYDSRQSEYMTPEMVRAAVIQIAVPNKAPAAAKAELLKRAEEARSEALKLGPDTVSFGGVAVKYSDDQISRYRGGDTGLINKAEAGKSRWEKPVLEAIFLLKSPGEVSSVIHGADDYYVLKLIETKQAARRPFEEVREAIRGRLFVEKRNMIEKAFYDSLSEKMNVKVYQERLKMIEPPDGGKRLEPPALPGK